MEIRERPRLVITEQQVALLARRVRQLHGESGAECAFVSDSDGNILSRAGMTVGFDLETLALFVGKWFGAAAEIGWYLGDSAAFDLNYHDGAWYDLYAANIGKHLFLTLIFSKTAQASKIGMVWVLTRRAVAELLKLLESATLTEPPKPPALPPAQKPLTPPRAAPQVSVASVELPPPAAAEPDELERELMAAAEESHADLFTGMTYEQAKAMGLIGALEEK
jgi:hypothetical protein